MRSLLVVLVGLVLITPMVVQAAKYQLYRYQNAEGRMEMSNAVPPERVPFGYEIIDSRTGRLIEKIDPQKSQAEVDRITRETTARNACKTALERVNSLYQSAADVGAAEQQALKSLNTRIENAEHNLRQAREQKRDYEATAAQLERAGKSLNKDLVKNIELADARIDSLEAEIEKRHGEEKAAKKRFAKDLALFKQATCANEAALGFNQTDVADGRGRDPS